MARTTSSVPGAFPAVPAPGGLIGPGGHHLLNGIPHHARVDHGNE